MFILFYIIGLQLTKRNVLIVLQKSRLLQRKHWQKTFRCLRALADERLSPAENMQILSENLLDEEKDFQWWKLGMKLIRCCSRKERKEIETIDELMKNIANCQHSSKFSTCILHSLISLLVKYIMCDFFTKGIIFNTSVKIIFMKINENVGMATVPKTNQSRW